MTGGIRISISKTGARIRQKLHFGSKIEPQTAEAGLAKRNQFLPYVPLHVPRRDQIFPLCAPPRLPAGTKFHPNACPCFADSDSDSDSSDADSADSDSADSDSDAPGHISHLRWATKPT